MVHKAQGHSAPRLRVFMEAAGGGELYLFDFIGPVLMRGSPKDCAGKQLAWISRSNQRGTSSNASATYIDSLSEMGVIESFVLLLAFAWMHL